MKFAYSVLSAVFFLSFGVNAFAETAIGGREARKEILSSLYGQRVVDGEGGCTISLIDLESALGGLRVSVTGEDVDGEKDSAAVEIAADASVTKSRRGTSASPSTVYRIEDRDGNVSEIEFIGYEDLSSYWLVLRSDGSEDSEVKCYVPE